MLQLREKQLSFPHIRHALPDEAQTLSELAFRSKAYWEYDAEFMEACRAEISIDADAMNTQPTFVIDDNNRPAGFYSLANLDAATIELDLLFVDPAAIGRGFGGQLWRHAVAVARNAGFHSIKVVSDPYALPFYQRCGARPIGLVRSASIAGRYLPLLNFPLK